MEDADRPPDGNFDDGSRDNDNNNDDYPVETLPDDMTLSSTVKADDDVTAYDDLSMVASGEGLTTLPCTIGQESLIIVSAKSTRYPIKRSTPC